MDWDCVRLILEIWRYIMYTDFLLSEDHVENRPQNEIQHATSIQLDGSVMHV